ncbi:MAG: methyltransferase domain-containing protein [Actinobacteria bacterium]|nr:methyltransferase domain-containing protein [Actinomycetota bacterium]
MADLDAPPTGLAARRAALQAIAAVDERDAYSTLAVPAVIDHLDGARDRAFASYLAYDTLRWQGTLDWALQHVLDRDLGDVEPSLRRILRLGALQILRSGVPTRAAVDTAVRLARAAVPRRRATAAGGFVNGVLRALARRRDELPWPNPDEDAVGWLVLHTAHPRWIVEDLHRRLGAQAQAALEADNVPPGLTLRATGDRDALVDELRDAGIDAVADEHAPEAVRAPGGDPRRLAAVADGRAVPQDAASMRVAHATGAVPGARVLDLCAGPGGKATHLASLVAPGGSVIAVELYPHRAALIREAAARVGVDIDVRVGDATDPPVDGEFDVVLVDAPCTGLGTGRRRPEVRWRRGPHELRELADLQSRLLQGAAAHVAPAGSLTYAACTWTVVETEEVTARFLARHRSFELVEQTQLWPHHGTDGMYHATFVRRG